MYSGTESDSSIEFYNYNFKEIEKSLSKNDDTLLMLTLNKSSAEIRRTTGYEDETLFHIVAKYGHIEAAKRLIEHQIDINVENNKGQTPLFIAVVYDTEIVKFLLNHGADPNILSKKGETILQEALLWGAPETVQVLLEKLIDYQIPEDNRVESEKCHQIVKFLLNQKIDDLLLKTKYSLLLHFALNYGDRETFKLVLKKGQDFDVNGLGPCNQPILHRIIEANKYSCTQYLVEYGADVNIKGHERETALHYAVKENKSNLVNYLLAQGADVNAANESMSTPLHYAVAVGRIKIVKLLLAAGADIKAKFINGYGKKSSVLNIVCGRTDLRTKFYGKKEPDPVLEMQGFNYAIDPNVFFDINMIKFLVEVGADTAALDKGDSLKRFTPLERAYQSGHVDIVEYLMPHCHDPRNKDFMQTYMLWRAVDELDFRTIDLLIQNGVDINVRDQFGRAPLYYIVRKKNRGSIPFIEFLADNGANLNSRTLETRMPQKETALHLAVAQYLPEMVECLLALNADFTISDLEGRWPLTNALESILQVSRLKSHTSVLILIAVTAMTDTDIYNSSGCEILYERGGPLAHEIYQLCKKQVRKMKRSYFILNRYFSLYDFLKDDLTKVLTWPTISEKVEKLDCALLRPHFPHYSFLIKKTN
ncbi:putative ankyrin repeat protein RF_0381 [Belonocnema kinseyi]|uniref:putative ankyrin repeat protein RF_0381 n=1 Tax=Belonocnema kinseyi TaxID=2817044 RepID=UPI00143DF779|nr:putative ankyrin repeat protein RF_0381 [Belonocnema kinseyi]